MSEEQAATSEGQQPEPTVIVRMSAQRGNLNPGDIAGLPASRAASYIKEKAATELVVGVDVDADANPLRDLTSLGSVNNAEGSEENDQPNTNKTPWEFDPKTDPFTTDGISKQASLALHAQGLHTVDAVRNFIANMPEDIQPAAAISEIENVTDAQAEKIVKLYGMVTEHSDE